MSVFALSLRAIVRASRGDAQGSRSDGTEALERSERLGWLHGVNQSRWALAVVALSEDDPTAAATWLEPVIGHTWLALDHEQTEALACSVEHVVDRG